MIKRFKSSKKVWIDYAAYLMERGELDSARNLLQRSFKSLEKRKRKFLETLVISWIISSNIGSRIVICSSLVKFDSHLLYIDLILFTHGCKPSQQPGTAVHQQTSLQISLIYCL